MYSAFKILTTAGTWPKKEHEISSQYEFYTPSSTISRNLETPRNLPISGKGKEEEKLRSPLVFSF